MMLTKLLGVLAFVACCWPAVGRAAWQAVPVLAQLPAPSQSGGGGASRYYVVEAVVVVVAFGAALFGICRSSNRV